MIRCLSIWFLCFLSAGKCFTQTDYEKSKAVKTTTSNNRQPDFKAAASNGTMRKGSVSAPKALLDVLFATNEDCDLYINEELKGQIFKDEFLYLKLAPGNYKYKAVSKSTHDELKDTCTVTAGKINEVFLDLLYVVDEKNAQREGVVSKPTRIEPVVLAEKNPANAVVAPIGVKNNDVQAAVINTLIANMVLIKGGKYMMGNNRAPVADEAEHQVTVSKILFSKYEVTQHQWEAIMGYNPSGTKNCATCPVENVSWEDAMKFIKRLNAISDKNFRLPTEAEWEYVARIGGKMEIDTAGGQEKYINKTAWYFGNANKKTHPVGILQANVAGVFDLGGNVSEWCMDWYGSNYYKQNFNQLNPQGPASGKEKVIRGGNFKDYRGDRFRPSLRNKRSPIEKSNEVGFRVVLETHE